MASRKRPHEPTSVVETPTNGINSSLKDIKIHNGNGNSETNDSLPIIKYVSTSKSFCKPAPFSTDPEAVAEREACDYTQKISVDMAKSGNVPRKIRIYTDGIYDLFHQGHARQMMQAKNFFPNAEVYLMIGACNDEITHSLKGRTVMTDDERYEAIRHCRYVDEIIRDAPWKITEEFMEEHKIDFVAQDSTPYASTDCDDVYKDIKEMGRFVATERTHGISTSDIVCRIVRDYDLYVRRNFQRGYTAKELNVSFLNDKKFKLQNKIDEMKCKSKRKIEEVKEEFVQKWEEKSGEFIRTFLMLFGRDNLSQFWDRSQRRIKDVLHRSPSRESSPSSDKQSDGASSTKHDSPPAKRTARVNQQTLTSDDTDDDEEFLSPTATTFPSLGFTNPLKDNQ